MSVQFLGCELSKWEEAGGDALVLTFFSGERPLRGAAGLADWRLCGRLSRLIKQGRMRGEAGEALMMPPGRRLPFRRILLFGLGRGAPFDETVFRGHVRRIREVVRRAGIHDYALQPPGRATGLVAARRALEMWIQESDTPDDDARVAIIDTPGAQKEMADILHARQRLVERQQQMQPAVTAQADAEKTAPVASPGPATASAATASTAAASTAAAAPARPATKPGLGAAGAKSAPSPPAAPPKGPAKR